MPIAIDSASTSGHLFPSVMLIEVMTGVTDAEALKAMAHGGPLIPAQTEMYDFVRRAAKAVNPTFDEKGGAKF